MPRTTKTAPVTPPPAPPVTGQPTVEGFSLPVVPHELPADMKLEPRTFARYMRLVEMLGRRTGIKVHVSATDNALVDGDIFLFNHFTRFETVVAPYIIHRETGKMARSVAYHGLFDVNDTMSRVLYQSGGVPTNLPRLLPFLAEEILRGRKVIIFPEGGLVKDKSVVDANGNLKMWSGSAEKSRKPHRGAAVLAMMLDMAKRKIRAQFDNGDTVGLAEWCAKLDLSQDELRAAVAKPTLIVPANITFYPMRTNPNMLVSSLERLAGPQGRRTREELTIEGNLLLRPTDMDVRFGAPISAMDGIKRLQTTVLDHVLTYTKTMDEVFALKEDSGTLLDGYVTRFVRKRIDEIREDYSRKIYLGTTININHLVATLVRILTERGHWEYDQKRFRTVLYVALKNLQQRGDVNLHLTLARPEYYVKLRAGTARGYVGFMEACNRARLIEARGEVYKFSRKLYDQTELHDIRLENPLQVHVNEASPIVGVKQALEAALVKAEKISEQDLARLRFDDMVRMHAGQRYRFGKKAPYTLLGPDNVHTGRPYLLEPDGKKKPKKAVVLVHGFATTPGELRGYADHLREEGKLVLGVRLPGHGTSPYDLEERSHMEWLDAVRDAYEICAALADEVVIVGFSTGGALSLILAQEKLPKLTRVASVAAPLLVSDSNMRWLPVGMALRKVLGYIPGLTDLLRFYPYDRDNTAAIYPHVPLNALNELRRVIGKLPAALPRVTLPVLVMQGLLDHTVKSRSASMIFRMLGSDVKALRWIASGPHGLIALNFGATWEILDAFVDGDDVTGNTGVQEHNIRVEPSAKKNAALKRIIRKFG